MMRYALLLTLISLAALLPLQDALAQDIAFGGTEVVNLAKAIVDETAKTNQLPSAYQLTMTNGHTMVITAPNAFELLARSIIAWQATKSFPTEVSLQLHDIKGSDYHPEDEPKAAGQMTAVLAADIGNYADPLLKMTIAQGNTIPRSVVFLTKQKLTAAQFIVAMSALLDETTKQNAIPKAFAIPLVCSPQNWLATERPVVVAARVTGDKEPWQRIDLRISLNEMDLTEAGPVLRDWKGPIPPFCGAIHVELQGFGPVGDIQLMLDSQLLNSYKGIGPHRYELDTLPLADGLHTISATATDTSGTTNAYVFSFTVQNGRRSGFTPAQIADLNLEATTQPR